MSAAAFSDVFLGWANATAEPKPAPVETSGPFK